MLAAGDNSYAPLILIAHEFHAEEVLNDVLQAIEEPIEQVSSDRAYDHHHCHDGIAAQVAKAVIPPRKDAVIWQHGNCNCKPHPRDENLRHIRKYGRKRWKRESSYNRRSIAETTMFRFKTIFGGNLSARKFDNQAVELFAQLPPLAPPLHTLAVQPWQSSPLNTLDPPEHF
ncbi:transposase [Leptolyngbya sp. FACHB-16]|nr:transposase [Leptolyngbya sp. FACHB-8]MBD2158067.1 transposase [Leptolyngbya sp. FACHB-16]